MPLKVPSVTRPAGLFGRFAHAIFAPEPNERPFAALAKSQLDPLLIPIEKSQGRILFWFAVILFGILTIGPLTLLVWSQGEFVIALILIFVFIVLCLGLPQLVQVWACEQSPLALEAEGLRVNFAGDFIRYDQITKVTASSYQGSGKLELRVVPEAKFNSNRMVYRLFGHPHFMSLYTISVHDLAGEIERRMKVAEPKAISSEARFGAST
jgi:hypothetical protein